MDVSGTGIRDVRWHPARNPIKPFGMPSLAGMSPGINGTSVSFRQRCIAAFFGGDTSEIAA